MKKFILTFLFSALLTLGRSDAKAVLITFEDFPTTYQNGTTISNTNYKDLNWQVNGGVWYVPGSTWGSWKNAAVSGDYALYSYATFASGADSISRDINNNFDLISAYFLAGLGSSDNMTVIGYDNGSEKYNRTFTINPDEPMQEVFNWTGIDEIRLYSNAGGYAMDDLLISPVPEPTTMALGLMSIAGLAFRRRNNA